MANNNQKRSPFDPRPITGGMGFQGSKEAEAIGQLLNRIGELANLISLAYVNDRSLRRVIMEKLNVTDKEFNEAYAKELVMSEMAVEIMNEEGTSTEAKIQKAVEQGLPLELISAAPLIAGDPDLTFEKKIELGKKFGLDDLVEFMLENEDMFRNPNKYMNLREMARQ